MIEHMFTNSPLWSVTHNNWIMLLAVLPLILTTLWVLLAKKWLWKTVAATLAVSFGIWGGIQGHHANTIIQNEAQEVANALQAENQVRLDMTKGKVWNSWTQFLGRCYKEEPASLVWNKGAWIDESDKGTKKYVEGIVECRYREDAIFELELIETQR